MIRKPIMIAAITIAALTPSVAVNGGDGARLGGMGWRVEMVPRHSAGQSDKSVTRADCNVRVNQQEILLHFSAGPFEHVDYPDNQSDTVLAAGVTSGIGAVAVSPKHTIDRTNLSRGDDGASVAMRVAGNGRTTIRLDVGLKNPMAIAGEHCTTVVLTVTGR